MLIVIYFQKTIVLAQMKDYEKEFQTRPFNADEYERKSKHVNVGFVIVFKANAYLLCSIFFQFVDKLFKFVLYAKSSVVSRL